MKNIKILLLFAFISAYISNISAQVVNMIPPEHLDNDVTAVLEDWRDSGTNAFDNLLHVDMLIDVSKANPSILPDGNPCGSKINTLIDDLFPEPSADNIVMLYFPAGTYLIEQEISLSGYTILKGAGSYSGDPNQTLFNFNFGEQWEQKCITLTGESNGVEDIFIKEGTCSITIPSIPTSFTTENSLIYIVEEATKMETTITQNGFTICSGKGVIILNVGKYICGGSINPNLVYSVTTKFSNAYCSRTVSHKITPNDQDSSFIKPEDEYIKYSYESSNNYSIDSKQPDESYYQYTINVSGNNNWIRGVESYNTRKYHVYIGGNAENNTISGSYFHHAVNYTNAGGRGYGVCIAGNSKYNRVEDNIFQLLRHSLVLQGDAQRNVISYNYSRDVKAYNGPFGGPPYVSFDADDLCLHGRVSTNYGPKTNLLEGNFVVRSRVDDTHDFNGPYNTFFRNRTSGNYFKVYEVKEKWRIHQYKQNVIGCNMEPTSYTCYRLDQHGFRDDYPDYSTLSGSKCSLYQNSEPNFFLGWIQWPYTPWPDKIIPAKYRWDSHLGYFDPAPLTINQGWDDYENLCAPPNREFVNLVWKGKSENFLAMQEIYLESVDINKDNNLLFHAEEKVVLKPGTKIQSNNNHVTIKAGNVCDSEQSSKSKYAVYQNESISEAFELNSYKDAEKDLTLNADTTSNNFTDNNIQIFPNPNKGEFFIYGLNKISKDSISIIGIHGNLLPFKISGSQVTFKITLQNNYKGLLLIHIKTNNSFKIYKTIVE
jgi:hypothetical protein